MITMTRDRCPRWREIGVHFERNTHEKGGAELTNKEAEGVVSLAKVSFQHVN